MKENRDFSRVGLSYTVYIVMMWILLRSAAGLLWIFGSSLTADAVYTIYYIAAAAVQYGVCLLFIFLLLRRRDGFRLPQRRLSLGGFIMAACIICSFILAGTILGSLANGIISAVFGIKQPSVAELLSGYNSPVILFIDAAVIAPVAEEFIFRKLIIDRLYPGGKAEAILVSALLFGAAHGNFEQFFYAAGIGVVFAYIYANTGRLRYSVFLHFVINLIGVLQVILSEDLALRLTIAWGAAVFLLSIAGVAGIIGERRKLKFLNGVSLKKIFLNFGMITAVLLSIAMFVYEYMQYKV